ncbi:MAG: hypothetical protein A3I07_04480 [Candidatus Doudnabacteria bacterium RIFCSPLOWO2_02_FULL_42_9]|uniref:Uncharacterized protein n=1 Tax=Candidatus Doudnabacteria bacterium RIFCSPHIGHO2_01_FULL_41_86 TaxID=1817821 RepID=A0A1F5NA28_9BACT|nr:MAG: hypothetical protein A2717_02010 [Candidatus Doudnabacteria bacterium RIFCSPHIGHO2_01_FULL_41_86]OGE75075.1 MAG: hypothetical protein A3K07_03800 [Candidatus Doudnabacteria bacterium RIFCSPHIGHO2_01_43_10]OGE85339.1 MAG: hypothetical protein A3E28_01580 [Candidatus Doudnabacteria bacterium RIFCSPHIGHO2_12_FULL_42_22]OGE86877.1 MAG: hypothetical protein A3C49_02415 [Candidatus Doudnabacteria bacterium RIFCSPHIGHO2_02_FULL_42_25]OGE92476.1 MAG: hypothetical protein A2895_02570 [Candidatus
MADWTHVLESAFPNTHLDDIEISRDKVVEAIRPFQRRGQNSRTILPSIVPGAFVIFAKQK